MRRTRRSPYEEIRTLRFCLISAVPLVLGLGILIWTLVPASYWITYPAWQAIAANIGAFISVSMAIGIAWETLGKKSFYREVVGVAGLATEASLVGLKSVGVDFQNEPAWDELFACCHSLCVAFTYGRTWRNSHYEQLLQMVKDPKRDVEIFLPDPNNAKVVASVCLRMAKTDEEVRSRINDAVGAFTSLKDQAHDGNVKVYFLPRDLQYSLYKFDETIVVAFGKNRTDRTAQIPFLVCTSDGALFDFFNEDLQALRMESQPQPMDPPRQPGTPGTATSRRA